MILLKFVIVGTVLDESFSKNYSKAILTIPSYYTP